MDSGPMLNEQTILWAFLEREEKVFMLSDRVAYSWNCGENHEHNIRCLWIWHDCNMSIFLNKNKDLHWSDIALGWKPSGVGLHDLISPYPLHIEASVYWPGCCGMHGWIRNGVYVEV